MQKQQQMEKKEMNIMRERESEKEIYSKFAIKSFALNILCLHNPFL